MIDEMTPTKISLEKKASLIVWLLTLILLTKFGNTLISFRVVPERLAWLIFDLSQLIESILLPLSGILLCKSRHVLIRALMLSIFIYNVFSLLEYSILTFYPRMFFITSTVFTCFLIPLLYRFLSTSTLRKPQAYEYHNSFLVFKQPKNLSGSICALVTAPYGHCSLVTYGREFIYKNGVLIEREFNYSNNLTFKKIPKVELVSIRKLIGTKWTICDNCFRTFGKFRKP